MIKLFDKTKSKIIITCFLFSVFCFLICGCRPSLEKLPTLYKKLSTHYEQALKNDPKNHPLRLKLAEFYYRFNDYQRVKDLLEKESYAQDKETRELFAKALTHLKDYIRAFEVFEQFPDSTDNEYLYLYGRTCEEKNLFPQAIKIYKKVKAPYGESAKSRIEKISIKIEEGTPLKIKEILKEEEDFLSQIKEEEAAILLADEVIEIKENNTALVSYHGIEMILQERGKRLGEVTIGYDSTYQRVELEYARTITPQNKGVYAGKENIRDVSKYLNYPLYSNARVFIISMPSVEVGSVIEYKVKIYSSKLINEDDFTFIYQLKEKCPIAKANFKLIIPKKREIYLRFLNEGYAQDFNLSPTRQEEEGKKIYSWQFSKIPPIIPEDKMPYYSLINPAVIISSFSSWSEIYSWWQGLVKDKLSLSKEIKEFTKNLIKDCSSDYEKAKKIYEFCAKNIRYVAVEYGESGHEPHQAEDIFWMKYGDCKDKTTLLAAMLKAVDLKAYPVLIPTREAYSIDEDFASLNFDHAICAYPHQDQLIFMDPTSTTASFSDLPLDDQERKVLVFFDEGCKVLTTPAITENEVIYETKIAIDENEDARLERKVAAKGFFAQAQRAYFKYSHPQRIRDDLQRKIVAISPFAKLIDYQIENADDFDKAPVLKYNFVTKKILNPAKNLRVLSSLHDIEVDPAYVAKPTRTFPIEFEGIYREISKVRIDLPSNLEVKFLPQKFFLDNEWFTFKAIYAEKERFLDFDQEFAIKKRFVEKEEYNDFKKELEKVSYRLREELILEKRLQ